MAQSTQSPAQYPPPPFSPVPLSPSPANSQSSYPLPPNKRVRTDGPSPQPGSPYPTSSFSMASPPGNALLSAGSPPALQSQLAQGSLQAAASNGQTTPTLTLPDARPSPAPPVQTPQPLPTPPIPQYTNATMAPILSTPTPGTMGPPQRPADRPAKGDDYDVTDSLAGTGIDLRAEEQFMSDMYSTSFDANAEARNGHGQQGPAKQPQNSQEQSFPAQDPDQAAQEAEKAWNDSAARVASHRTQEMNDPWALVALIHRRAEKIAKEHHLSLNLEMKTPSQSTGRTGRPEQTPTPVVATRPAALGTDILTPATTTASSWIPQDAYLADQVALISLALKQRVRELIEDADGVAINRQKTSHGEVPTEWEPAAAPLNREHLEPVDKAGGEVNGVDSDEVMTNGVDGNGDAHGTPAKRSASEAGLQDGQKPAKMAKIASYLTLTMREAAKQEREWEEARLRRRQKRKDDGADPGAATPSRSNSIAPGTPGSVAPTEKQMTKKEQKKNQALKAAEASSHANQNLTSSMFAGMGGRGLFNKKKKKYDWMTATPSGASTPSKPALGGAKGPMGATGTAVQTYQGLTTEARNRLGAWREDKEKGKNIQLRDWVNVLERDGRETRTLQHAYLKLDSSRPA